MNNLNDNPYLRERDELLAHLVDDGTISAEGSEMATDEQQAMTSERLAVIERHLRSANNDISRNREETVDILRYSRDVTALLAEVARLRAREAALLAVVRAVAEATIVCQHYFDDGLLAAPAHLDYLCPRHPVKASPLRQQARALLASVGEERSGGDGG